VKEDRGEEVVEDLPDLGVPLNVLLVALNELVLPESRRVGVTLRMVR